MLSGVLAAQNSLLAVPLAAFPFCLGFCALLSCDHVFPARLALSSNFHRRLTVSTGRVFAECLRHSQRCLVGNPSASSSRHELMEPEIISAHPASQQQKCPLKASSSKSQASAAYLSPYMVRRAECFLEASTSHFMCSISPAHASREL